MLFLYPPIAAAHRNLFIFDLLFTGTLLFAIYAISDNRRTFLYALMLGIPSVALPWVNLLTDSEPIDIIHGIFIVPFFAYITWNLLRFTINKKTPRRATLVGAANVYLMLGITWSSIYKKLEHFHPGSFSYYGTQTIEGQLGWWDFTYFSFVTLTTLGYGDIAPYTPIARSLAMLEAIVAILFTGILVASLLGTKKVKR